MQDFRDGNLLLRFVGLTGTVLGQTKFSETAVHGSGGGGFVRNGQGSFSDVQISSTSSTRHEVWMQGDDGVQHPVDLSGAEIPLQPGQRITLAYAQNAGNKSELALLINHSAQRYWQVVGTPRLLGHAGNWALRHEQLAVYLCLGVGLVLGLLLKWWLGLLVAIALPTWLYLNYRRQAAALAPYLDELANWSLQRQQAPAPAVAAPGAGPQPAT